MVEDVTAEAALTVSERELSGSTTESLSRWLGGQLGDGVEPRSVMLREPESGGMSSVSVPIDVVWHDERTTHLIGRMPPERTSFPVFPAYDFRLQYEVMTAVRRHSDVPVPELVGLDEDGVISGEPMLVMERIDGTIPADNPPYVFDGWLHDSTPERRAEIQESSVALLATLHGIGDVRQRFPELARLAGTDPLRAHVDSQRRYYEWTCDSGGPRVPLIERAFDWLEHNLPTDPGPTVLSWGDARIGNIVYDRGDVAGVLDWEMAALGPRELDLGWFLFMHRFFQDIAESAELSGIPSFLDRAPVVAAYERMTGHRVANLDWYVVYAALRHAIVMARIKRRMIHFGEDQEPADADDYVMHRQSLQRLLDGSYVWPGGDAV